MYPNLKAEMARRDITQRELADKIGVARPWLNRKLVGKVDVSIRLGKKIKKAIGTNLSVDELFEETCDGDIDD